MKQKENWKINPTKDENGLYCIERRRESHHDLGYVKVFTVAVFFDELHEYGHRYEFLRSGLVIAIVNKISTKINGLSNIQPNDYKLKTETNINNKKYLLKNEQPHFTCHF